MRSVTIETVQGVGDVFWVYQKVVNYVDEINFVIMILDDHIVQKRCKGFIELLPKVKSVEFKKVDHSTYHKVAECIFDLKKNLETNNFAYACNKPLELGVKIEDIDPELTVARDIKFNVEESKTIEEEYTLVYISGNKPNYAWDINSWGTLVASALRKKGLEKLPIVFLGAEYDRDQLMQLKSFLETQGFSTKTMINNNPPEAIRTIRDAKLFIGYQSGLNVIADNYNVPQIMIYFPQLKPMMNSWCKQENIQNKVYQSFTFDQSVNSIVESIYV